MLMGQTHSVQVDSEPSRRLRLFLGRLRNVCCRARESKKQSVGMRTNSYQRVRFSGQADLLATSTVIAKSSKKCASAARVLGRVDKRDSHLP